MDVFANEQFAVQTDSIRFNFQFNNRLGVNASLVKIKVDDFDSTLDQVLSKNKNLNFLKTFFVPVTKQLTQPYWLENKMAEGYFNVANQEKIGRPDVDPSYTVNFLIRIENYDFNFTRSVKYKYTDPVRGELYQPLVVVPSVILTPADDLKIVLNEKEKLNGNVAIRAMKRNVSVKMAALNAQDKKPIADISFNNPQINISTKNQVADISYSYLSGKQSVELLFAAGNTEAGNLVSKDRNEVKYDHIPNINYFHDASVTVKYIDVKTYGKKIGYIPGAGDKIPEALEQMGYEVNMLTEKELSKNSLDKFDAIITGIRAYNTNDWISKYYDKLMRYVEQGGNMIVQYNTNNFISTISSRIGPYPFTINRNRITDENAPVKLLNKSHPAFTFPNLINEEDFKGWIQERSIYHATDTSGKYEKLISMNDPGENPDDGSLLVAKFGKGYFTYTGIVFFRELPAGVPGAYRLLANLIALNIKKAF
jgi:hypothetical protein